MILARCHCGATYQIKDEFAGKTIRCKKCNGVFTAKLQPASGPTQKGPTTIDPLGPSTNSLGIRATPHSATGDSPRLIKASPHPTPSTQVTSPKNPGNAPRSGFDLYDRSGKSEAELRREREEATLAKHVDKSKLDVMERFAMRRRESIEEDRVSNSLLFCIYGLIGIALAALIFWGLSQIGPGDWVTRNVALLYYSGARWWLSAIFLSGGLYFLFNGFLSFTGKVDIVEGSDNDF